MPFKIGDLNEFYVNIGRVGADDGRDFYQFSRPVEGLLNISVQPLSAPLSVEILDNFGNVLSAANAAVENPVTLFLEHDSPEDYLLKISSIDGETPYQVSIYSDSEVDPITNWGITEGFFVVDSTGEVSVDYLFDGGSYQGELAIFSLKGMENLSLGSSEFITEAASRALSNSTLGHVVISDSLEGAKFSIGNNFGEYSGLETFSMSPGDVFAAMLVPNGTVQEVYENPEIGGNKRPLFSLATANPSDAFHVGQVGDITGDGSAFVIEDLRVDTGTDRDYNDIIWQFSGAVGLAMPVEELIAPEKDWRSSEVGQELLNAIASVPLVDSEPPEEPVVASAPEPVVASAPEPVVPSAPEPVVPSAPEPVVASAPEPVVPSAPEPVVPSAPEPVVASNEPVAEVAPPVENEATSHESQDDGANSHQENLAAESENSSPESSDTETDTEIDPPTVPEVTEDPTSGESARWRALAPATADDISVLPVEPLPGNPEQFEQGIGSEIIPTSESNPATAVVRTPKEFTSGVFTVGETGEVGIDFLFDGGKYQGEVAIFSLSGLDEFELGSPEFISEVAHRALSNSASGYVAISDRADGAEFSGKLGESVDWNEGEYESKTFAMNPSERFGIMLVPNGTVAEVAENPTLAGAKRPLFSMATDDPDDGFHGQQLADVTGDGVLFAWEDLHLESWSDRDYNDILFSIKGATGSATDFDAASDPEKDWRNSDLGQEIIQSVLSPVETETDPPILTVEAIEAGISGRVEDFSEISSLRVGFDATPTSEFVSVTASLAEDGSFTLDGATLEAILGTSLNQNSHVLYLEAADIHGNIGVTAIRTGEISAPTNEKELNLAVGSVYGLDPYPDGIALPAGGQRQLSLRLNGWPDAGDVSAADSGTRYFVSHPDIVNVTADGMVTALKEGVTTVTIFYGATSVEIPVGIEAPEIGPAVVGEDGGIVVAADGSFVMLPPGALNSESSVSLTPLGKEDLSLEFPDALDFAGAFELEVGDERLDLPAQLAIRAPENMEPGTEVLFARKGSLPDENNNWTDTWLIEESGVVGSDGLIHTNSPPFGGILDSGTYALLATTTLGFSPNNLALSFAPGTAQYGSAGITFGSSSAGTLQLETNFSLANSFLFARTGVFGIAAIGVASFSFFTVMMAYLAKYLETAEVTVGAIPEIGLPMVNSANVEFNPEGIPTVTATIDAPTSNLVDPLAPPVLQSAELKFESGEPRVFLEGSNFVNDFNDLGSSLSDLRVEFRVGTRTYEGTIVAELSEELAENRFKVAVSVPETIALGEAEIVLIRPQKQRLGTNVDQYEIVELETERSIQLAPVCLEHILAAQESGDSLSVLNTSSTESVIQGSNSSDLLTAKIPVGTPELLDKPVEVAATNNGTRAYVTLAQSGRVALVDLMTLRQVDTNPLTTGEIDPIDLPALAAPGAIAIHPTDKYAYIADSNSGAMYVLDIDPLSDAYNQVTEKISLPSATSGVAGIELSPDGRKLFVAAPGFPNSQIIVINTDLADRPSDESANTRRWHEPIGEISVPAWVQGITVAENSQQIAFTTVTDRYGFGAVEITNDDPLGFAMSTPKYASLGLGSFADYFDINRAVDVEVMANGDYAFVAAINNSSQTNVESIDGRRAGSNIGIIQDPFGPSPKLVAATRPIPGGLTTDLELSAGDRYLWASYPGLKLDSTEQGALLGFNVEEIVKAVENPGNFYLDSKQRGFGSYAFDANTQRPATVADLARVPIDDINPDISTAADYQIIGGDWWVNFDFGVPDGSQKMPIAIGGTPNGLALASAGANFVSLVSPSGDELNPTFQWQLQSNNDDPDSICHIDAPEASDIESVKLFVSTFEAGQGLLPDDDWEGSKSSKQGDYNPNRILTATWNDGVWSWNGGSIAGSNTQFTLPDDRMLTAAQEYHWAVEVTTKNGSSQTVTEEFQTSLPEPATDNPFTSVTILTPGIEVEQSESINPNLWATARQLLDSGSSVLRYQPTTSQWQSVTYNPSVRDWVRNENQQKPATGKPLVLLADWIDGIEPVKLLNGGFAEAAADAMFASLVQLDQTYNGAVGDGNNLYDADGNLIRTQGDIFNSPLHFVGIGQGAVVNTEIIQPLCTHKRKGRGHE